MPNLRAISFEQVFGRTEPRALPTGKRGNVTLSLDAEDMGLFVTTTRIIGIPYSSIIRGLIQEVNDTDISDITPDLRTNRTLGNSTLSLFTVDYRFMADRARSADMSASLVVRSLVMPLVAAIPEDFRDGVARILDIENQISEVYKSCLTPPIS